MCGRFTIRASLRDVALAFDAAAIEDLPTHYEDLAHYNIAPTQPVPVVRMREGAAGRELALLAWGLVPSWAEDPTIGSRMINARAETVATKPAFRDAFRSRRCLVVADGFYEWKRDGRHKQPYYITHPAGQPFDFAGLWERWHRGELTIESCTIITTDANETLKPLHDRMPVILRPDQYAQWLDASEKEPAKLTDLLRPYPDDELVTFPVSTAVNRVAVNGPECIEPAAPAEREQWLF